MVVSLFDENKTVQEQHWNDMPEFRQEKKEPYAKIIFRFENEADLQEFASKIGQKLTKKTKSAWYPYKSHFGINKPQITDKIVHQKYPIYVISKGRANTCLTARELRLMGVDFYLVVEPCEYEQYKNVAKNILVLPFENLGQGSIPARNWVWEHSIKNGNNRHWILDDNIEGFHRLNRNQKPKLLSPIFFRYMEDFVDRYSNVALAAPNYYNLCKATDEVPAFNLNTRVYSCILIKNDLPYRWRGRYNEDTDLSLRALKDGWATVLFNAFLAGKVTTMRMKGGNTCNVYNSDDSRLAFAESLKEQHPDVVEIKWKFNRWHHQVNYKPFKKNKLIKSA